MPKDATYFNSNDAHRTINADGDGLPLVSEGLNSVRVYSFECEFELPAGVAEGGGDPFLTLAAKQVGNTGMSVEDIEVYRVNDRVFYPGRPTQDEVVITFDNLYLKKVSNTLWNWFKKIYDPMTGQIMEGSTGAGFKAKQLKIHQLNPDGSPMTTTRLFGVYPRAWKNAEFNYSNNQFHTVEVTFRYDFIDHGDSKGQVTHGYENLDHLTT
jgi:hypothetical protein